MTVQGKQRRTEEVGDRRQRGKEGQGEGSQTDPEGGGPDELRKYDLLLSGVQTALSPPGTFSCFLLGSSNHICTPRRGSRFTKGSRIARAFLRPVDFIVVRW